MDETCKENAASKCRCKTFQFEKMPFGLMNSQATFHEIMERVFLEVGNIRCYVDDVKMLFKNIEEHAMHPEIVCRILKYNRSFIQPSVELLGHIIDKNGVHIIFPKQEKVSDAILPSTRKGLRYLLGFASYY